MNIPRPDEEYPLPKPDANCGYCPLLFPYSEPYPSIINELFKFILNFSQQIIHKENKWFDYSLLPIPPNELDGYTTPVPPKPPLYGFRFGNLES